MWTSRLVVPTSPSLRPWWPTPPSCLSLLSPRPPSLQIFGLLQTDTRFHPFLSSLLIINLFVPNSLISRLQCSSVALHPHFVLFNPKTNNVTNTISSFKIVFCLMQTLKWEDMIATSQCSSCWRCSLHTFPCATWFLFFSFCETWKPSPWSDIGESVMIASVGESDPSVRGCTSPSCRHYRLHCDGHRHNHDHNH